MKDLILASQSPRRKELLSLYTTDFTVCVSDFDEDAVTADTPARLVEQLVDVWEASVRATHLFLSANEIAEIKRYVPQALMGVAHLVVAERDDGAPAAFMGVQDGKLEMLFLAPEERGKGLGRQLLEHGIQRYAVESLVVNEQNPQARDFYEHMGFQVFERSDLDEQGNPYPILSMRLLDSRP